MIMRGEGEGASFSRYLGVVVGDRLVSTGTVIVGEEMTPPLV